MCYRKKVLVMLIIVKIALTKNYMEYYYIIKPMAKIIKKIVDKVFNTKKKSTELFKLRFKKPIEQYGFLQKDLIYR